MRAGNPHWFYYLARILDPEDAPSPWPPLESKERPQIRDLGREPRYTAWLPSWPVLWRIIHIKFRFAIEHTPNGETDIHEMKESLRLRWDGAGKLIDTDTMRGIDHRTTDVFLRKARRFLRQTVDGKRTPGPVPGSGARYQLGEALIITKARRLPVGKRTRENLAEALDGETTTLSRRLRDLGYPTYRAFLERHGLLS